MQVDKQFMPPDMISAFLAGNKIYHAEPLESQPVITPSRNDYYFPTQSFEYSMAFLNRALSDEVYRSEIAPRSVGQYLWVPEAIHAAPINERGDLAVFYTLDGAQSRYPCANDVLDGQPIPWEGKATTRKPQTMQRICSRLTLKVKGIRLIRVSSITLQDVILYGLTPATEEEADNPILMFKNHWDATHGPRCWEKDEWCWLYEYEPILRNVGEVHLEQVGFAKGLGELRNKFLVRVRTPAAENYLN